MNPTYNPSDEGELNLDRACRWAWNFKTFLDNQRDPLWTAPVCLTFARDNMQYLLDERLDSGTGESIDSAGIRFYTGLGNINGSGRYLQLFAVRCEAQAVFAGNKELVYNDVYNVAGYTAKLFGYDVTRSAQTRAVSPLNPRSYPPDPVNNPQEGDPTVIQPDQGFSGPGNNQVNFAYLQQAVTGFYQACQPGGAIQPFTANTVYAEYMIPEPPHTAPFSITPVQWPWAFFFNKSDLVLNFGDPNTGQLVRDIRIYFGITDYIDWLQTGMTPGILKAFVIGVDGNNNDRVSTGQSTNNILDFSLPCPQYCGTSATRIWLPPQA